MKPSLAFYIATGVALATLAGCGQPGPLYMPKVPPKPGAAKASTASPAAPVSVTPAETASPATPAGAATTELVPPAAPVPTSAPANTPVSE